MQAQTDWTGFYLGVNGGRIKGRSATTTDAAASEVGYGMVSSNWDAIHASGLGALRPAGSSNGFTFGYNWQHGHGFLGIEADRGHFHESEGRSVAAAYPVANEYYGYVYTITQRVDIDRLDTLRLRAGVAAGRWLIFGTAGAARTRLTFREEFSDNFDYIFGCSACSYESGMVSAPRRGRVWGGGAEFQFAGHWSVKGEYLHARFGALSGRSDNLIVLSTPIPVNYFTYSSDLSLDTTRFGVNYRF